jgi:hypothetical protein
MRLPRAETRDVVCERDLAIAMDDDAVLLADRCCWPTATSRKLRGIGRSRRCWCARPTGAGRSSA